MMLVASYIDEGPYLKDSSQPILKYVVAGWQVGGVPTLQSGLPVKFFDWTIEQRQALRRRACTASFSL